MSQSVATRAAEPSQRECPECAGSAVREGRETICEDCGLVLDVNEIDRGPEWRWFVGDDDPRRADRIVATQHDRGLSTEIGWSARDANGTAISGEKRRRLARMRTHHRRARFGSKRERNLAHAFAEIRRLVGALDLEQSHREQACELCRQAQDAGLILGRSIEGMTAAVVYAVARLHRLPLTLDDVDAVATEGVRIKPSYRALDRELGLPIPPRPPDAFVPRIRSAMDCSGAVEERAREYLTEGADGGAYNPVGVAAGAVLAAYIDLDADRSFTQAQLADSVGVTTHTIRKHRDRFLEEARP